MSRRFGDTCAQHTRRPAGAQRTARHPGSAGLITEQGTATWSRFQFTPDSPDPRKVQRHLPRAAGEARPAVGKGEVGYLLPLRGSPAGHLLSRFRKSRGRSGSFERPPRDKALWPPRGVHWAGAHRSGARASSPGRRGSPPRGPPSLIDLLVGFLYSKYESRNIKMNHFKVNASVAPSTLTTLCDDHVRPPLDIFTTQKGE